MKEIQSRQRATTGQQTILFLIMTILIVLPINVTVSHLNSDKAGVIRSADNQRQWSDTRPDNPSDIIGTDISDRN